MKRGKLFVISGPSGVGKGTICRQVLEDMDMELSVSMTTREPREGEVQGVSYYFVSENEFLNAISAGGLLEHAKVYDHYYGTPKGPVMKQLEKGRDVILEIEMLGAGQIKEAYEDAVLIFITPPSPEELRKRLEGRDTESPEAIELRLAETAKELEHAKNYDYVVENGELSEAIEEVERIIRSERNKLAEVK